MNIFANSKKSMILAENTIKLIGGKWIEIMTYGITYRKDNKEFDKSITVVTIYYGDGIRNILEEYGHEDNGYLNSLQCKNVHQEIANQLGQDLHDRKLIVRGVNDNAI